MRISLAVNLLIAAGLWSASAADRSFWSFKALQVVEPAKDPTGWAETPIDQFIAAKHREHGVAPNQPAERLRLARRASLDLTGLPPTPEGMEGFLSKDKSERAWGTWIDDLLASPHYGERWARHWMDVARFGESDGFEHDSDRPHAYHYRDFLIKAFNQDMPYDQFVRWQLAGDEMAPDDPLALMATGFLVAGVFPTQLTEAEFESARYDQLDDMSGTTGVAFLGLSIGCARCHDHKFDPISEVDYYRLTSSFTTAIRSESEVPLNGENTKVLLCSEGVKPLKHHADGRGFPHFYKATHILKRGDVKLKQEVATQGFLPVLMRPGRKASHWQREAPGKDSKLSYRRSALGRWITDPIDGAGHLAARVIVNRIWQFHFGQGLVTTPNDFGTQGELPSHPELLDWLAHDLITHGWKLKRLHKQIMMSAVYQLSTAHQSRAAAIDDNNTYLWKFATRRLEGEAIRESLLSVSGLLDAKLYGPGTLDPSMKRRSVYFTIKRSKLVSSMLVFDWPEHLVSIGQRASTTIAPQALYFLNSPQARQYAKGLAKRAKDVQGAYRIAFNRPATAAEIDGAEGFIRSQASHHPLSHANERAFFDFCQTLLASNEFLYLP
jgi:hypothetical protein